MAIRKKVFYCSRCRRNTIHRLVEHESYFSGLGPFRIVGALATFGVSETAWADWFYRCERCGEIKEKSQLFTI